jgi:hypothetical protein
MSPKDGVICFKLAYEYEKLKQYSSAISYYQFAIEYLSKSKETQTFLKDIAKFAGLDYKITDEVSLGLKYIFTGTGNQNFGGSFQDLDTKGSYSQNVMLNCTLNF